LLGYLIALVLPLAKVNLSLKSGQCSRPLSPAKLSFLAAGLPDSSAFSPLATALAASALASGLATSALASAALASSTTLASPAGSA